MKLDGPLRLLTWNVWFGPFRDRARMQAIVAEVARLEPHIVAFQEVTRHLARLPETRSSPLRSSYRRLETPAPEESRYWEVIYTRLEPGPESGRWSYSDTAMARGCTILHVEALNLVVATTHLESLQAAATRERQFREAIARIERLPVRNRVLCGDMNLRDGQALDHLLPPCWEDAWTLLRPGEEGATRDAARNPMTHDPLQDRLDRIFVCCPDYVPARIELVGTDPIDSTGTLFPSDHFGLFLELRPRPGKHEEKAVGRQPPAGESGAPRPLDQDSEHLPSKNV